MERSVIDCARVLRYNFRSLACRRCLPGRRFHNAAYAPRSAASEIQTRLTIAQAYLRSSTFLSRGFCRGGLFAPAVGARIRQPDLIENAPHDCVHDCGYGTGTAVERRNSWENNRSGFEQRHDVARVNQIPWRLTGDEN